MAEISSSLYFLLCFVHILSDLFPSQVLGNKCDENLFYLPYVHVRKKRNGADIMSLKSSGFLDLRFTNRVLLCINGPVVLYTDVEKIEDDPKQNGANTTIEEQLRFKNGTLNVFNHECFSINRVPLDTLQRMKELQERPNRNPEITVSTEVNGLLVLGVYLIGNKVGHNYPELAWFKGPNFEHVKINDKTIKDSSFILTGNKPHCIWLADGTRIKIGVTNEMSRFGSSVVCQWKMTNEEWYINAFQRGFDANGLPNGKPKAVEADYEFFDCPDFENEESIIFMAKTTPEPITHLNYSEFDSFSMINPNLWTPHGFRRDSNGLSGGDEREHDKMDKEILDLFNPRGTENPCTLDPNNPPCQDSGEATTLADMQNIFTLITGHTIKIQAEDCMDLPQYDPNTCRGFENSGHRFLELVLELNPKFVPDPPVDPWAIPTAEQKKDFPKYKSLNDDPTLAWKYDLLYIISDIFSLICMPFRPDMSFRVARVFAWYVYKAHLFGDELGRINPEPSNQFDKYGQKREPWPILLNELERCRMQAKDDNGKALIFEWDVGEDRGKWKVEEENSGRKKRSINISIFDFTKEKLIRKKRSRSYKIKGNSISTKHLRPTKTLASVKSEGSEGFACELNQEYRKKVDPNDPRIDADKYEDHPKNIQHCYDPKEDPVKKKIICSETEPLFFYEDQAEIVHELNIAIDLWWKIWATVLGYCNKAYHFRKSETFPRLYNAMVEYYFQLVEKEWKYPNPEDTEDLKIVLGEYISEENDIWMDSCLESSYVDSNSKSFRPPRPMTIDDEGKEVANYFVEIPHFLYYRFHSESERDKGKAASGCPDSENCGNTLQLLLKYFKMKNAKKT